MIELCGPACSAEACGLLCGVDGEVRLSVVIAVLKCLRNLCKGHLFNGEDLGVLFESRPSVNDLSASEKIFPVCGTCNCRNDYNDHDKYQPKYHVLPP